MFYSDTLKPGDVIQAHNDNGCALVIALNDGEPDETHGGKTGLELLWLTISADGDRHASSHEVSLMSSTHAADHYLTSVKNGPAKVVGNLSAVLAGLDHQLIKMFCSPDNN